MKAASKIVSMIAFAILAATPWLASPARASLLGAPIQVEFAVPNVSTQFNNYNTVVTPGGGTQNAFLYSNGTMTDLGTLDRRSRHVELSAFETSRATMKPPTTERLISQ
jgi:hypothetical protein